MANKQLNVTLIMRHDTAANWASKNPVLAAGELGIETDTRKYKLGDGTSKYSALKYGGAGSVEVKTAAPTGTDKEYDIGTLWVDTKNKHAYVLLAIGDTATWLALADSSSTVAKANEADSAAKLKTPRTITLSGAVVTNAQTFDGSGDVEFVLVLANSGVTAGTYTKLTVNEQGVVTSATTLTAADIPALTLAKITDAGTAASKNVGTAAGNVPVLNSDGKLDDGVIPAIALTETFTVASQAEMLALSAQRGDVAIRTDTSTTYILTKDDPTTLANWVLLKTPDCKVLSVNGKTGAVVLTTDNVAEGGSNLYFTAARATANFNTNFAAASVTGLKDGTHVVLDTDTITINGGNA